MSQQTINGAVPKIIQNITLAMPHIAAAGTRYAIKYPIILNVYPRPGDIAAVVAAFTPQGDDSFSMPINIAQLRAKNQMSGRLSLRESNHSVRT
jgi:hypothetical protein